MFTQSSEKQFNFILAQRRDQGVTFKLRVVKIETKWKKHVQRVREVFSPEGRRKARPHNPEQTHIS